MASKRETNLPIGFLVTESSPDRRRVCVLEVRHEALEEPHLENLKSLAHKACQLALREPQIRYLSRKAVPWEEARLQERQATQDAIKEFANYERVDDRVLALMGDWYAQVCLLERELEEGSNIGLQLARLSQQAQAKVKFAQLHVIQSL